MQDQTLVPPAETNTPTPEEQVEQTSQEDIEQLLRELGEATKTVETDDLQSIFVADEGETWLIPTGRFDEAGRPVAFRVKVKDPKRPELPTQYLAALSKVGPDRANFGLWQACIVEPKALKNEKNYEKTTTAFRSTLSLRLQVLAGVNGDFFAANLAINSQAPPPPPRSAPTSPTPSAGAPQPSPASPPPNSTTPTVSPAASPSSSAASA